MSTAHPSAIDDPIINRHAPVGRAMSTEQQTNERRFARARGPTKATWLLASIRKSKLSMIRRPRARTPTFSKLGETPFETEGRRDGEGRRQGEGENGRLG
jgi:hypothetical protein